MIIIIIIIMETIRIIGSRSNFELAEQISKKLNVPMVNYSVSVFANTEINIKLNESVRDYHIYIVGTGSALENRSINDHIMELLLLIDSCRRSNAKSVSLVIPCYPYARSDKRDHRGTIASKLMTDLFINAGVNRIIAVDLHAGQIQGFTNEPFDNIYAMNTIINYMKEKLFTNMTQEEINDNFILASPDHGGIKRVEAYCKKLHMDHITLHKQRDYTKMNCVMNSSLIGDKSKLTNKTVILIDDMIDTAGTMVAGANELVSNGAKDVILLATHGILSGEAINRINLNEYIQKVIITNSIDQNKNIEKTNKIDVISLDDLLSQVITRLVNGNSLSELFD